MFLLGLETTLRAENQKNLQYDHTEELQTCCQEWLQYSPDQLYSLWKWRGTETTFKADAEEDQYRFIMDDCCTFLVASYGSSLGFLCVFIRSQLLASQWKQLDYKI